MPGMDGMILAIQRARIHLLLGVRIRMDGMREVSLFPLLHVQVRGGGALIRGGTRFPRPRSLRSHESSLVSVFLLFFSSFSLGRWHSRSLTSMDFITHRIVHVHP